VALIVILNRALSGNALSLAAMAGLGSLLFCLAGVVVGLSARSQTSAGALNSLLFMLCFMPVVLCDVSRIMAVVCKALPSFYLYEGIGRSMLAGFGLERLVTHLLVLLLTCLLLFFLSVFIIRKQEA